MELSNTFTVNLPVAETWAVLMDLARVIPCLPGAALTSIDGDDYHGGVKIKVGPVTAQYRGIVRFLEKDERAHRAVIRGEGKDVGGQGGADATITVQLQGQGHGTQVEVDTNLALSGRVAQFGRGVIADVSNKLLGQFVKNLEAEIARANTGSPEPRAAAVPSATSLDDVEPLDMMGAMGGKMLLKYGAPAAGALTVLVGVIALFLRKDRKSDGRSLKPSANGWPGPSGGGWSDRSWSSGGAVPLIINFILPSATSPSAPHASPNTVQPATIVASERQ